VETIQCTAVQSAVSQEPLQLHPTLLAMGAARRLALALAVVVLLWLAVWWALA